MEDLYKQLGFDRPKIRVNRYGIKIYIGEKGEDDWGVEIPNELCKEKCDSFIGDKNYMYYGVTEEDALRIARTFTELAERMKGQHRG